MVAEVVGQDVVPGFIAEDLGLAIAERDDFFDPTFKGQGIIEEGFDVGHVWEKGSGVYMSGAVVAVGLVDAEKAGVVANGPFFTGIADDGGDNKAALEDLFEGTDPEERVKGLGVGEDEDAVFLARGFLEEVFDGFYDGRLQGEIG